MTSGKGELTYFRTVSCSARKLTAAALLIHAVKFTSLLAVNLRRKHEK